MGAALSIIGYHSITENEVQVANNDLTQSYSGACSVECDNTLSGAHIKIKNSRTGPVTISQACTANGQCMMSATQDSLADTLFKAQNNAGISTAPAPGGFSYSFLDIDRTKINGYTDINTVIQNSMQQKCSTRSANDMSNVTISASDSFINGAVSIGQTGNATGTCSLQSLMSATARAQGIINNCASDTTGKGDCGSKGGTIGTYIQYAVIAVIIMVIIGAVIATFAAYRKKLATSPPASSATGGPFSSRSRSSGTGEKAALLSTRTRTSAV